MPKYIAMSDPVQKGPAQPPLVPWTHYSRTYRGSARGRADPWLPLVRSQDIGGGGANRPPPYTKTCRHRVRSARLSSSPRETTLSLSLMGRVAAILSALSSDSTDVLVPF